MGRVLFGLTREGNSLLERANAEVEAQMKLAEAKLLAEKIKAAHTLRKKPLPGPQNCVKPLRNPGRLEKTVFALILAPRSP